MTRPANLCQSSLAALIGLTGAALADTCAAPQGDTWELSAAEIETLYDCIAQDMQTAYAKSGHPAATAYRGWTVASTRPAVAGPHGDRLLQTFANAEAAESYLAFAPEGVRMPAGSVLAKESIALSADGTARVGPLFLMTKLDQGGAPDSDDWFYEAVQPDGRMMRLSQSFCHDCHGAWQDQDSLAYPLEEVRVGN
ncbi:recombinase [Sedimentitalea sp. HM32M-2]|uniref:recombinase n=1 Tax=Sedimentitalea sp. HM32M-2 TaxID=3351566 RepID=UPI00363949DA